MKILYIALAGALGTVLRYALGGYIQRATGANFPWGTFSVNMAGCFLFGLVWSMAEERMVISGESRAILLIGFMGAFTTFSTFMFETDSLLRNSQWMLAFANLLAHNILGIAFLMLGFAASRALL